MEGSEGSVWVNGSALTIAQLIGELRCLRENVAQKTISDSLKEELLTAERLHGDAIALQLEKEKNGVKYHLAKRGDMLKLVPVTESSTE
tara:strand:+ start:227 stop:493 length:267 start_codon:yes stop_codon:yes gene_type:complete